MVGVRVAETAELFNLHTVGMLFLIFSRVIVALLTGLAGQCYLGAHGFSLTLICPAHKKRTPCGGICSIIA